MTRQRNAGGSFAAMLATTRLAAEIMESSARVVAHRASLFEHSLTDPTAAMREVVRLAPEKFGAFSRSGRALLGAWLEAQEVAVARSRSLAVTASRRPAPRATEMVEQWWGLLNDGARMFDIAARGGRNMLAPVHAVVTANDRRLSKD